MIYSIGITTFSLRYEFIDKLIPQIRSFTDKRIFLCINGEIGGEFSEEYRIKILNLCSKYENIFPIFFVEIRGLSKMWNTLLSHSDTDNMLMLNDDLEILTSDIFTTLNGIGDVEISKINNSFSHYIVNRKIINSIGWFDEKLLGFGEEDGDITYRLNENGISVGNIAINGIKNIVSDIRQDLKKGTGKYSKFNRDYMFNIKYSISKNDEGVVGMFGVKHIKNMKDINSLPNEKFFWENKNKL